MKIMKKGERSRKRDKIDVKEQTGKQENKGDQTGRPK